MNKFKFKFPEKKYKHNELPVFVIDETNKTIFLSFFMLIIGLVFAIRAKNISILLFVFALVAVYAVVFFFCFYRHFIFDNLLIYDGYITSYDEDTVSNKIKNQLVNRYIRKYYTVETVSDASQEPYILKIFVKDAKFKNDMKVRLYVLPNSFIKNRDGSFNVQTVYTEILETPKKKKGNRR